jgi:hypothetical protein
MFSPVRSQDASGRVLSGVNPGRCAVFGFLLALLVGWVLVAVVAALIGGLFWLTVVAGVLFLVTAVVLGVRSARPTPR